MKRSTEKSSRDGTALVFFIASAVLLIFGYGVVVGEYKVFPYALFSLAKKGYYGVQKQLFPIGRLNEKGSKIWYSWCYIPVDRSKFPAIRNTESAYQGVNLVTRFAADYKLAVDIMDMDGHILHTWDVDWFRIWPDAKHLPADVVPQSKPGTHVHGAYVMENGDLLFNFELLGLVRLDRNSNVIWRLPYRTHHSICRHTDGNFWVCGLKRRTTFDPYYPFRSPPYDENTIIEVSPEGKILHEWSVQEILARNGYSNLLNLGTPEQLPQLKDDRLHLNNVEPFPTNLQEDFFRYGDILVSLRNIHTVFVFNKKSGKIKYITTGAFGRQHDPDFIDGNTFSVFDNQYVTADGKGPRSRIVIVSARENTRTVYFAGSREKPFFTQFMGKHQWLPNGNLLIADSLQGRAFELDSAGDIVWEYVNYVVNDTAGLVEEVKRLPLHYAGFIDAKQ